MSRTKRGSKSPGYDYWSKRPHGNLGFGRAVKILTHRAERQQAKEEIVRQSPAERGEGTPEGESLESD